jgi:lipopolysaccharide/colanic/teichoic acid biosynthesis glycosyltransferase
LNVLLGHMSLVGPRPMSVRDVSLFGEAMLMRRFTVKPGITGLWQVSGRSSVGFDQWIKLDFNYIDDWSLALDFWILARTVKAVVKRTGAV